MALTSPPRPFLLSYVTLPLIVRPKEFRPVFASLAAAAVLDGQPRRRRLLELKSVFS